VVGNITTGASRTKNAGVPRLRANHAEETPAGRKKQNHRAKPENEETQKTQREARDFLFVLAATLLVFLCFTPLLARKVGKASTENTRRSFQFLRVLCATLLFFSVVKFFAR
jgi:hypothetical protein